MEMWEQIESHVNDDCGFQSHVQVLVAETEKEFSELRGSFKDLSAAALCMRS